MRSLRHRRKPFVAVQNRSFRGERQRCLVQAFEENAVGMVGSFEGIQLRAHLAGDQKGVDPPRADGDQGFLGFDEARPEKFNLPQLTESFSLRSQNNVQIGGQVPKEPALY